MLTITELNIFPVKSLAGISLKQSTLGVKGLSFDRHWMLTDNNGQFLSQRKLPQMALIKTHLTDSELILSKTGQADLVIKLADIPEQNKQVTVWRDQLMARQESEQCSIWLQQALALDKAHRPHLVRMDNKVERLVEPDFCFVEGPRTDFADAYPYLLTSTESLHSLNAQLTEDGAKPVTMDRFRANIVVEGMAYPWQEHDIDTIADSNGFFSLALRKPCQRCPIPTIDQVTGTKPDPKQPLSTLTKINRLANFKGAYFGNNGILLDGEGETISVGQQLKFTELGQPLNQY